MKYSISRYLVYVCVHDNRKILVVEEIVLKLVD